jgi:hypothetical protein
MTRPCRAGSCDGGDRFSARQRAEKPCAHNILTSPGSECSQACEGSTLRPHHSLGISFALVLIPKGERVRPGEEVRECASPRMRSCHKAVKSLRDEGYRGKIGRRQVGQGMNENLCILSERVPSYQEPPSLTIWQLLYRTPLVTRTTLLLEHFESRTFSSLHWWRRSLFIFRDPMISRWC